MGKIEGGVNLIENINKLYNVGSLENFGENEISKEDILNKINDSIKNKKNSLDKYMSILLKGENIDTEGFKSDVNKYFNLELMRISNNLNDYFSLDELIGDINNEFDLGTINDKINSYKKELLTTGKDKVYNNIVAFSNDREFLKDIIMSDYELAIKNIKNIYLIDNNLAYDLLDTYLEEENNNEVIMNVLISIYEELGEDYTLDLFSYLLKNNSFVLEKDEEGYIGDIFIQNEKLKKIFLIFIDGLGEDNIIYPLGCINILAKIDIKKAENILSKIGIDTYLVNGDFKDLSNFSLDFLKKLFKKSIPENELNVLKFKRGFDVNSGVLDIAILNSSYLGDKFVADMLIKTILKEIGLDNENNEEQLNSLDNENIEEILFNILSQNSSRKDLFINAIDFNLLLSSKKYLDILTHIGNGKGDILSKLHLGKYLLKMDMPFNILIETLDKSESYDFVNKKDSEKDIKNLISIIGKEYGYTDAKNYRIDPKVFEGTIVDPISRFYESKIEEGIDLSVFNPKYIYSYVEMIKVLDILSKEDGLFVDKVIKGLDFSEFIKKSKDMSYIEIYDILNKLSIYVTPSFGDILFEKLGFSTEMLNSKLDKYTKNDGSIEVTNDNINELSGILSLLKFYDSTNELAKKLENSIFKSGKYDLSFLLVNNIGFTENDLNRLEITPNLFNNIFAIEQVRNTLDANYDTDNNNMNGDEFILKLQSMFFEKYKNVNYSNFNDVYSFSKNLKYFSNLSSLNKDKTGIYGLGANFGFNKIISFLDKEIGPMDGPNLDINIARTYKIFEKQGINLYEILNDFQKMGISYEIKESNLSKGLMNIAKGNFSYVGGKIISIAESKIDKGLDRVEGYIPDGVKELFGTLDEYIPDFVENIFKDNVTNDNSNIEISNINEKLILSKIKKYSEKGGVIFSTYELNDIKYDLITFNKNIKAEFIMKKEGFVSTKNFDNNDKNLVFTAPLSFSTKDRRMTEIAAQNGEMKNLLISAKGKEGLVLTNKNGDIISLRKTNLKLSEFGIPELIKNGDRNLNIVNKYEDYLEFLNIIKKYHFSLLSNMLLVDKGKALPQEKNFLRKVRRRLLLTFSDGKVGILNGNDTLPNISSIAVKLGAVRAVYMDTGMYDIADYYDNENKKHSIGGRKKKTKATNFLIFRTKN